MMKSKTQKLLLKEETPNRDETHSVCAQDSLHTPAVSMMEWSWFGCFFYFTPDPKLWPAFVKTRDNWAGFQADSD